MFYMNFFLSVSRNMESVCLSDEEVIHVSVRCEQLSVVLSLFLRVHDLFCILACVFRSPALWSRLNERHKTSRVSSCQAACWPTAGHNKLGRTPRTGSKSVCVFTCSDICNLCDVCVWCELVSAVWRKSKCCWTPSQPSTNSSRRTKQRDVSPQTQISVLFIQCTDIINPSECLWIKDQ